ncbi:hypothetical protein FB45DRAFT_31544 [Roridomyces roridus]|uniref:Mid2 domain-containing protein n=1 Tax=Roridomyces roridus TaxID=1738132 RepID=A0AAD7CKZ1_9AGAR|nr:hypothetical protein FB45DRAFT_31544 [Roridomyces roridus]
MRLALYFFILCILSFVSGLRNVTSDDNDASIVYSPEWNVSSGNNSFDFGGSLHFSDNATASASLTFQGAWHSHTFKRVGVQVALDDQEPFTVDLEDIGAAVEPGLGRETVQSLVVWAATELPNTQHTIVISMPSTAQHVVFDGLIYSVVDSDNSSSVPPAVASTTSSSLTTTTTTESFSSSHSFSLSRTSSSTFLTSSSSPSPSTSISSKLSSTSTSRSPATPIENVAATSSSATTPVTTIRQSSPPDNLLASSSTSLKRTVAIGSAVAVVLVIAVLIALLCCIRRRRIRRRRDLSFAWSQKFSPYPAPPKTDAMRMTARPLSPQSQQLRPPLPPAHYRPLQSPVASPLAPPAPTARRSPRSPLATAPPIMPPSPSPQSTRFPSSSFALVPESPTPDSLTPPPPVTPGTPWSPQKSHRLSNASSVSSYESFSVESGAGYGWTTPSLVGIHPFSAGTGGLPVPRAEPSTSSAHAGPSTSRAAVAAAPTTYPPAPAARPPHVVVDATPLTPKLSEKSAAALFPQPAPPLSPPAPAYKEKDGQRLFAIGRSRSGSQSSEAAPPLYEP